MTILSGIEWNQIQSRIVAETKNREVHQPLVSLYRWWARRPHTLIGAILDSAAATLPTDALILDPFSGGGTVAIEATRRGHRVYSQDVNPWAAWGLHVSLSPVDPHELAGVGEGISLHRVCHHAIYVDRTFNAAHFLQSVDRIHRLGLAPDQVTRVSVLEAEGTIDANIARRLKEKIDVMATILDDPGLQALAYDPDDVIEEFPAGLELADVEDVIDHLTGDAARTE